MKAPLIVISGASGSGKTTLCCMAANDLGFYYSISYTTRPRRPTETHGVDYFFVDRDEFKRLISGDEFLEWAEVYGNLYGTCRTQIENHLKEGRGVIVDVDTQGALTIKKKCPEAVLIFILAPSTGDLKERLKKRGTDSEEIQQLRLDHAMKEESQSVHFDHQLVNTDLNTTFEELKKLIRSHL